MARRSSMAWWGWRVALAFVALPARPVSSLAPVRPWPTGARLPRAGGAVISSTRSRRRARRWLLHRTAGLGGILCGRRPTRPSVCKPSSARQMVVLLVAQKVPNRQLSGGRSPRGLVCCARPALRRRPLSAAAHRKQRRRAGHRSGADKGGKHRHHGRRCAGNGGATKEAVVGRSPTPTQLARIQNSQQKEGKGARDNKRASTRAGPRTSLPPDSVDDVERRSWCAR